MQIKVHKIYTLTRIHENCSRIVIEHSDHSLANFKMQKGGTEKCVCFIQICSCHRINLCSTLEIEIEDVHTKPLTPIIYYILYVINREIDLIFDVTENTFEFE